MQIMGARSDSDDNGRFISDKKSKIVKTGNNQR